MPGTLLSYSRGDDVDPFDPATSFVDRLHRDLMAREFEVWVDLVEIPSRGVTIHREIQDAFAAREQLMLVIGPQATVLDYVRHE